MEKLLLWKHPTTTYIVDDELPFMQGMELLLPDRRCYQFFTNPEQALESIKEVFHSRPKTPPWLQLGGECEAGHYQLDINIDKISKQLMNPRRFDQVSALVVDYNMPQMTGLDLCAQIKSRGTKKILLTGEADESIAADAFNKGLIDCYLKKDDPALSTKLLSTLAAAEVDYFAKQSGALKGALGIEPKGSALNDSAFLQYFAQVCDIQQISEYYLIEPSGSMLLVSKDGDTKHLFVRNQEEVEVPLNWKQAANAPAEILEGLADHTKMLAVRYSDDPSLKDRADWERQVVPTKRLASESPFYVSLVGGKQLNPKEISFYRSHQEKNGFVYKT